MLGPLAFALWIGNDPKPFVYAALVTISCGATLLVLVRRPTTEITQREGILLVFCTWVAVSLFGSLPFYFSPYFSSFIDAMFETTSGFTTTGATVLQDVEVLSRELQFWRCLSHWLGGMGIVLLGIAILPLLGMGGMALYRAEHMLSVAGRQRSRSPDEHCGRGGYDVQYRTGSRGRWTRRELRAPAGSGKMGVEFLYGGRAA